MNDNSGAGGGALFAELELPPHAEAVPTARRFARAALADEPAAVLEDAQLVATELVTNALLHGAAPVHFRVQPRDGCVRLEVRDTGRAVPMWQQRDQEGLTGRGLTLVAALASGWGIDPVRGSGKVVWAEITRCPQAQPRLVEPAVDVEALLASWPSDDGAGEQLYRVCLGAVPTDLLLAAKSHMDNVVREVSLAQSSDPAAGRVLVPRAARLIEAVTGSFAPARAEIKRQALAAAACGHAETNLVLILPASAADAGEEYLAVLDEADRQARSAQLLTLEAPPIHKIFRRWYVRSLLNQIRAQAYGEPAPAAQSLLQVLTGEVSQLTDLRRAAERLHLLQKVTAELTGADSVEDIARTVIRNATDLLGISSGTVFLLGEDSMLRSVAISENVPPESVAHYDEIDLQADLPASEVVRTGQAIVLRTVAQIEERYPELSGLYDSDHRVHVAPLTVGAHRLGVLSLAFPIGGDLDEGTQSAFVGALADALAQAMERALAMGELAAANDRLGFLADASAALSGSLDYATTLAAVSDLLVPRLADLCVVQILDGRDLRTVELRHFDPAKLAWASGLRDRYPADLGASTGAANVLRTGVSELYVEIPGELVELAAIDDQHLQSIRQLGMHSAVVVPLTGRDGTFGAITLLYAESGRRYDPMDVRFVEDVACRAALALETAGTFREQSGRLADVTRVAVAAQQAILARPPATVGPVALSARYVSASAEALVGGDLYEVVSRPGAVRLLIGDVRGKGLAAVRTATIVLGEFRAAAADVDDLVLVAEQIDRRVRPYLADEDFVTALLAEVYDDGRFAIAACGHPPALVAANGVIAPIESVPSLPLGLGAAPVLRTGRLEAGDRLLLYTDGVIEARDPSGRFIDLLGVVAPLLGGDLDDMLDEVLRNLCAQVGPDLGDDVALLVAEYLG